MRSVSNTECHRPTASTVQRRSRLRRTPHGKRLLLTPRDLAIFKALAQYRYLRSTYLHAFVGGQSTKRFTERLGDLFHEGYVDRPDAQWRLADCLHQPVLYELGRKAANILEDHIDIREQRRILLGPASHRQFEHSVMLCDIVASIELAARASSMLRFIPMTEIVAKAPDKASVARLRLPIRKGEHECLVPDALFGLVYISDGRPSYRFFALEADRGSMPIRRAAPRGTSLAGKFIAYQKFLAEENHKRLIGVPNLLVLLVTTNVTRVESLMKMSPSETRFLYKAIEPKALFVPAAQLLLDPWDRVGSPSFRINLPG